MLLLCGIPGLIEMSRPLKAYRGVLLDGLLAAGVTILTLQKWYKNWNGVAFSREEVGIDTRSILLHMLFEVTLCSNLLKKLKCDGRLEGYCWLIVLFLVVYERVLYDFNGLYSSLRTWWYLQTTYNWNKWPLLREASLFTGWGGRVAPGGRAKNFRRVVRGGEKF